MFQSILDRLELYFAPERIAEQIAGAMPSLIVAVVVALTFVLGWRLSRRAVTAVLDRMGLDRTAKRFAETVLKYVLLTIGTIAVLGQLGINVGSFLASLGVLGLTIGFAAQDTLSNLISGLFIFWDRPFVIGDLVEIDGKYGRVSAITMRSTRVVTVDGRMLAIPNREIVNSTVASYTNFPHIRIDVQVTIAVTESIDRVRELAHSLVKGDDRFMDTPLPTLVVKTLNDYNVEVEYRVWLKDEREHVAVRFEMRERLFKLLTQEGVDMPFEHMTVEVTNAGPRALAAE